MTNKVNEMVLGFAAVFLFSLVSIGAKAETVINYDDGSTYTLEENQEIYISTPSSCTEALDCKRLRVTATRSFCCRKPRLV